jgi:hypothetical protein
MIAELSRKLRETFGFSENHIRAVLYDLRPVSEAVVITGDLHCAPSSTLCTGTCTG